MAASGKVSKPSREGVKHLPHGYRLGPGGPAACDGAAAAAAAAGTAGGAGAAAAAGAGAGAAGDIGN